MEVRFLGAHNIESDACRMSGLLVDGVLALDAGSLTGSLSFAGQLGLKAVLLTHQHYDHCRDLPALGMNLYLHESSLDVYGAAVVKASLESNLLQTPLYPNFLERPLQAPALRFNIIEAGQAVEVAGYQVLSVAVRHGVPATGYWVTAPDGKSLFYTSDTGPGLAETWRQVKPDLLVTELTAPNRYEEFARQTGHLTAALLREELVSFKAINGYLPRVVLVHMNPLEEKTIAAEIAVIAADLNAEIRLGHEGLRVAL